ncbi:MAG TPA: universal stress protein [Frankiaceae bacterium]|jgi:nucleotide-binding universal stress UspA family protein|nr:universal stress protein [Frankiaceae bacterium]
MSSYTRVLVGTDGSETSYKAVDRAAAIAKAAGARLLIVSAYRPLSQREQQEAAQQLGPEAYKVIGSHPAEDVLREACDRVGNGVDVDTIALDGDPVDVLIRAATERKADLLVVGNRGLNSLTGRLLGSVPSVVTHRAPCDVLIVATT